jgi:probable phosphoglycerate mutase
VTQLYLIRHAEAALNVGSAVMADHGLTTLGVAQAERLRDRLAATGEVAADVLLASPMRRARQTAEIVAPALGLPVTLDAEVEELRIGEAEGLRRDEVRRRWGRPDFVADPDARLAPGAESPRDLTRRVCLALGRITATHSGKTVVVVCHGGVIANAFVYFLGLDGLAGGLGEVVPLPEWREVVGRAWTPAFTATNASITHWALRPDRRGRPVWHLVIFNDATHLRDLGAHDRLNWASLAPAPVGGADELAAQVPRASPGDDAPGDGDVAQ